MARKSPIERVDSVGGFYDGSTTTAAKAVNAGHRDGKRKRGVSVTKRKPRSVVRVFKRDLIDNATGDVVRTIKTITYKPPE